MSSSPTVLSTNARLVEVILFLENEPVRTDKIGRLTGLTEAQLAEAIGELKGYWEGHMHGLDLVESNGTYCFLPSNDLHGKLRDCYGKKVDRRLSNAALETLSIIAYSQPVTRRDVENIRGVSSDNIIRLLREREYIKVVGRKDVPGHPGLYGTTKKFLFEFNLPSISALPKLSEIDRARFTTEEELNDAN
ncbi:SMC-Scp complex subunit ScpB [Pleomorphochaeta sp. DL1XJH-081]|uniref:SMC-Scp complex subunit ScpB n=1 Tax=Pleomorphochaeta sp. DL1XJH-081 TaxID=3409690 RepID=UPI003BB5AD4A